jgi:hypothetical protein
MQPLATSILTAPIAAIDRRALSQAWYSALHVQARAVTPDVAGRPAPRTGPRSPAVELRGHRSEAASRPQGSGPAVAGTKRETPTAAGAPERRAPRSALARRIESAFLNPRTTPDRATFSVGDSGGSRVHVTLQSVGGRVRLVALCLPSARERVARALEQARYALAARGVVLENVRIGESPC